MRSVQLIELVMVWCLAAFLTWKWCVTKRDDPLVLPDPAVVQINRRGDVAFVNCRIERQQGARLDSLAGPETVHIVNCEIVEVSPP